MQFAIDLAAHLLDQTRESVSNRIAISIARKSQDSVRSRGEEVLKLLQKAAELDRETVPLSEKPAIGRRSVVVGSGGLDVLA